MNGCGGCYCGNCSECANSCNVTTGGVSYSRISHHHYHKGKLTVLCSCNIKSKGISICYVSAPQSIGSPAGCVNFQKDTSRSSVIYSEQENENKVLAGLGCFDRCQQIEKNMSCGADSVQSNEIVSDKMSNHSSFCRSVPLIGFSQGDAKEK